jgi:hypothetical protein
VRKPIAGAVRVLAAAAAFAYPGPAGAAAWLEDPAAIAAHVERHAEPLDWGMVFAGPERLIYLGERHTDVRPKTELVGHLRRAAEAGITHLAIEMLGEDRRELLERYGRREAADAELLEAFSSDWGPKSRGFMPEEYTRVVFAAREAGLRVEPLDLSVEAKRRLWQDCVARKGVDACADSDDDLFARDDRMMENLARLLAKPGTGRVLAWTGGWHACALEQAAKLAVRGFPSRGYYLMTRGKYEVDSGIVDYLNAVERSDWAAVPLLIRTEGAQACFAGLISVPR